jgi:MFS family permease
MTVSAQLDRPVQSSPAFRWGALLVLLSAVFVSTLDFFIVNVAIPSIQTELPADADQIQWTIAGFSLAVGAGVITAGRLGDLFGGRRMFCIGLALLPLHRRCAASLLTPASWWRRGSPKAWPRRS